MVKNEHLIKMNTGARSEGSIMFQNESSELTTDTLTGKLNSVIVDSDVEVSITIESELGYIIFHKAQHKGINYYAPRALLQGALANVIVQDQFDKFKLNERLIIRISGPTNTEVTIILRLD